MTTDNIGMASAKYMTAKANRETAYERYNYAGAILENAQIKERLAEMISQHEPLAALCDISMNERDRMYAAAYYVVVGRLPEMINIREETP